MIKSIKATMNPKEEFPSSYTKIQWGIIIPIIFLIDSIWIYFSSFKFNYSIKNFFVYFIIFFFLYVPYALYKKFRPDPKIMAALLTTLFFSHL